MNLCNLSRCDDVIEVVGIVGLDLRTPPTPAVALDVTESVGDLAVLGRQLEATRFVAQKVITPILVAFGVVGNVVNIAVLTRRWMKSSTNCYLTALAVYDVLFLLLALVLSLHHYDSVGSTDWYISFRKPVVFPLTNTFSNTGVWLTLTFTVERYIGVGHPMKGKVWCTTRRAKVIVVVVCLSAALVTFPEFFDWTTAYQYDQAANRTVIRTVHTAFGQSKGYAVAYKYINQTLFTFLPLALLSVFNALLVKAVVSASRWRQHMNAVEKGGGGVHGTADTGSGRGDRHPHTQQRITVMLIAVVLVFLLCQTPQAVQNVLITYLIRTDSLTRDKEIILTITANVFNLLVIANCCSNFILYSSFSSKFRLTFHKLFCASCMTSRKRASLHQLYSDAAVTTLPLRRARNDGRVETVVVCNELWPSSNDVTGLNGQSVTAPVSGEVASRVAIQLAKEMADRYRSSASD